MNKERTEHTARTRVWRMPVILNGAILAGLMLALLIDAGAARALAWMLLAIPLGVIAFGWMRNPKDPHRRAPHRAR